MNFIEYRGVAGTVEFSKDNGIFFGRAINVQGLVSYEGATEQELEADFQSAVDDYLSILPPVKLTPSPGGRECLSNGEWPGYECCCDECDHAMECYPMPVMLPDDELIDVVSRRILNQNRTVYEKIRDGLIEAIEYERKQTN